MSSSLQVPRMRAAARRVKASGERFLGGVLPGASARRLQIRAFADEWAAANLDAKQATGPLWIVLGDSASQGIGATTRDAGYVGVVHELLRRREAWRVINLSTAGAGVADVLSRQLPELAALTAEQPAELVSCLIGVEDIARRTPGLDILLRQLMAALPSGTVVGTLARGARSGPAAALDAVVREEAARHRMRIAELPPRFGPGGKGRGATVLNDVEHAAWAKAVLAAIDSPPAEVASSTDPELPVVSADTDPHLPVVPAVPATDSAPEAPADATAAEEAQTDAAADAEQAETTAEATAEPVADVEPAAETSGPADEVAGEAGEAGEAEPAADATAEPVADVEPAVETSAPTDEVAGEPETADRPESAGGEVAQDATQDGADAGASDDAAPGADDSAEDSADDSAEDATAEDAGDGTDGEAAERAEDGRAASAGPEPGEPAAGTDVPAAATEEPAATTDGAAAGTDETVAENAQAVETGAKTGAKTGAEPGEKAGQADATGAAAGEPTDQPAAEGAGEPAVAVATKTPGAGSGDPEQVDTVAAGEREAVEGRH